MAWGLHRRYKAGKPQTIIFSAALPQSFSDKPRWLLKEGKIKDYNSDSRYTAFGKDGLWVIGLASWMDWSPNFTPEINKRIQLYKSVNVSGSHI